MKGEGVLVCRRSLNDFFIFIFLISVFYFLFSFNYEIYYKKKIENDIVLAQLTTGHN